MTLPYEKRLNNFEWDQDPEHRPQRPSSCRECDDTAQILYATSEHGTDQQAPCPYCRLGWRLEHGFGMRQDPRTLRWADYQSKSPYGPDGFWMGRDVPPTRIRRKADGSVDEYWYVALSERENALRMRLLETRSAQLRRVMEAGKVNRRARRDVGYPKNLANPDVALHERDPEVRLELVRKHLAEVRSGWRG